MLLITCEQRLRKLIFEAQNKEPYSDTHSVEYRLVDAQFRTKSSKRFSKALAILNMDINSAAVSSD